MFLVVWTMIAAFFGAACSKETRPNVVVIVLDTARPDYLSAYGHPRPTSPYLEEFAQAGTRFDRAYSTSSWTLPSHASLFTGTLPEIHGANQANAHVEPSLPVLAEELQKAGYDTAAFSNNVWISKRSGLDRGFATFRDRWKKGIAQTLPANVRPTVTEVQEWLAKRGRSKQPFFLFVNLIEPHMPYLPRWEEAQPFFPTQSAWQSAARSLFPPGKHKQTTQRHYARQEPLTEPEWNDLRGLYQGSLRQADGVVRAIMTAVDAASPSDKTIVFLMSDHGENLGDHDHVSHIFNVYDSNLRIALLVRGPGFAAGAKDAHLVQITDVYPTILHAAHLETGRDCAGLDLLGKLPDQRLLSATLDFPKLSLRLFPEEMRKDGGALDPYKRELHAAVSARWKIIRGSDGKVEIYDLVNDPREEHPVTVEKPGDAVVHGLEAFVETTKTSARGSPKSGLPKDPAVLESLRALGYVE